MELGGVLAARRAAARPALDGAGDEWVTVPAGPFRMGAGDDGFAYDNERPRHARRCRAPSASPAAR